MQTQVEQLIADNKVMIFSKSYCPFCKATKKTLEDGGVEAKAIEMDLEEGGEQMHEALKAFSGQKSVPCTYIGGVKIGGNDDF